MTSAALAVVASLLATAPKAPPGVAWTQRQGDTELVADARTVYVGSRDSTLYAYELASGTPRWRFRTHDAVRHAAALAGTSVYVGSRFVYRVDATSGHEQARFADLAETLAAPLALERAVAVLVRTPKAPVQLVWLGRERLELLAADLPCTDAAPGQIALVTAGPRVFVACGERVVAYDARAHSREWTTELGAPVARFAAGRTLWAATAGALVQLAPQTGRELGRIALAAAPAALAAADAGVYIASAEGWLEARDEARGVRWRADLGWAPAAPLVQGALCLVASADGVLHALSDANGVRAWSLTLGRGAALGRPLSSGSTIVVPDTAGGVHGVR